MKLVPGGPAGLESPAVLAHDGRSLDLSSITDDIDGAFPTGGLDRARAAVALGQLDPKPYPRPGDVVEIEIDGPGRQRQVLGQA